MFVHSANLNIKISGLEGDLLDNVKSYLSIYRESKSSVDISAARIHQLHKQASGEIKKALQAFGYYATNIKKDLQENIVQDQVQWMATYDIRPGDPIRVLHRNIEIIGDGQSEIGFVKLIDKFPLKEGEVLNYSQYETAKQALIKNALANGYLKAAFISHEIKIDLEKYSATINLVFDTGPQYRFGAVRFVQIGEQLDENFLRRYLPFKEGDAYNTATLLELQTALSDSDFFTRIEIYQRFEEAENLLIPLEVNVSPRKPRKYRFGLGYGTDSGARASVEHQRRVSPKGHVLTLKGKVSQRLNRVDMFYSMPLKDPAREQLTMSSHYVEQRTESRRTNAGGLDLRRITGFRSWRQAVAISYEREGYEVADEKGSSQLLMPNMDWLHNRFNNRLYPTKGIRFTAEISLSHEFWFSDVNFIQLRITGKKIFPLFTNGRVILKALGGGTLINDIESLPASKRFYAGGDQTIRGYGYEELGPKNNLGQTIGGKYLAVAGVEYEHRVLQNWGVAVFFDAGNSFTNVQEKIYRGVGVGGRWRSKVGPIRLDLGWPLDKTVDYPRLHLIIGLDL